MIHPYTNLSNDNPPPPNNTFHDYLNRRQKKRYIGVDISAEGINIGRKKRPGAEFVVSRAEDYNLDGVRKFDFIAFSEMIYFGDHKKIIAQYLKYLNPGGYVALSTWFREGHMSAQMGPSVFQDCANIMNLVDDMKVSGATFDKDLGKKRPVHFRVGLFQAR